VLFASITFYESGKLSLGYEDNIKMHLKEMGNEGEDWNSFGSNVQWWAVVTW
jgi:hypothetical protein